MNSKDTEKFMPDSYGRILQAFTQKGYRVVNFEEVDPHSRHLILRHDIDVDLNYALKLAEFEYELGFLSCYFIMLTSEQYNPATTENRNAINRIVSLGHRIGLHFDTSVNSTQNLEARALMEQRYLSNLANTEVSILSFHRPSDIWINNPNDFAGLLHTYQPQYFTDIGYCSDSGGSWRYGNPLDHKAVFSGKAIQLLTHPIWWMGPLDSARKSLDHYLEQRKSSVALDLHKNIKIRNT